MPKDNDKPLSRRAAMARLGMFAAAGYTAPALTTLSMAHASSSSSSASSASSVSSVSSVSSASSTSSGASMPSLPSDHGLSRSDKEAYKTCRKSSETLDEFGQCVADNTGTTLEDLFPDGLPAE